MHSLTTRYGGRHLLGWPSFGLCFDQVNEKEGFVRLRKVYIHIRFIGIVGSGLWPLDPEPFDYLDPFEG